MLKTESIQQQKIETKVNDLTYSFTILASTPLEAMKTVFRDLGEIRTELNNTIQQEDPDWKAGA